jgi:hypothetical protein
MNRGVKIEIIIQETIFQKIMAGMWVISQTEFYCTAHKRNGK